MQVFPVARPNRTNSLIAEPAPKKEKSSLGCHTLGMATQTDIYFRTLHEHAFRIRLPVQWGSNPCDKELTHLASYLIGIGIYGMFLD